MGKTLAAVVQAQNIRVSGVLARDDRYPVRLISKARVVVHSHSDNSPETIEIINISKGGFATGHGLLFPGECLLVDLPVVGARLTEVRWVSGDRAGCRFIEPLSDQDLRSAVAANDVVGTFFPGLARALAA